MSKKSSAAGVLCLRMYPLLAVSRFVVTAGIAEPSAAENNVDRKRSIAESGLDEVTGTAKRERVDIAIAAAGVHEHLVDSIRDVYRPAGLKITATPQCEPESAEYGAARLGLNGQVVAFRVAKTTPTKIGQFVTIWKRPQPGDEIAPLDVTDDVDFVVVSVHDSHNLGQFVFPRKLLAAKGVMSRNGKGGKRAIRVYPPWTQPVAKAAIKTQEWQLKSYFANAGTATKFRNVVRLFSHV